MSKIFSNVFEVPLIWIVLFIVYKRRLLTISSWISVARIARQSNPKLMPFLHSAKLVFR
jgi:hypothetical protein